MMPIESFPATLQSWQNFYLLVGTAAATLIGLMFVAVTFGSSLVTRETSAQARAFLDPTFAHFAQVLVSACLVTIPIMGPRLLGGLLLFISTLRTAALVRVFGHMRAAHRRHGDIELSDWLMGIALPFLCYLLLGATGAAFVTGQSAAFAGLAIATLLILLNGIFGAWETMVWLAVAVGERRNGQSDAANSDDRSQGGTGG
jgi:hypothetical protein